MTKLLICTIRKCLLWMYILAPPEGLCARGIPWVNLGGQGVIPWKFKQKKNFVTDIHTHAWTYRRIGQYSNLNVINEFNPTFEVQKMRNKAFQNAL